jgi:hypothetical protein
VDRVVVSASPAEARLEDQIAWYDAKSQHNQRWFKLLEGLPDHHRGGDPCGGRGIGGGPPCEE